MCNYYQHDYDYTQIILNQSITMKRVQSINKLCEV